jgi:hypothetical protein
MRWREIVARVMIGGAADLPYDRRNDALALDEVEKIAY